MNTEEIAKIVVNLRPGTIFVDSQSVSDWDARDEDGDELYTYWEPYTYEASDGEVYTLVSKSGTTIAAYVGGKEIDLTAPYEDYADRFDTDEDDEPISEELFRELAEADPMYSSATGPAMNYLYPLDTRDIDEVDAAIKIAGTPLVLVETVGGEYGLALAGGGMDLTWEICEAYIALGYLPPVTYADLPGMAGKPEGEMDHLIIAACRRSYEVATNQLKWRLERFNEQYGAE
jgi:hypothetical protein